MQTNTNFKTNQTRIAFTGHERSTLTRAAALCKQIAAVESDAVIKESASMGAEGIQTALDHYDRVAAAFKMARESRAAKPKQSSTPLLCDDESLEEAVA